MSQNYNSRPISVASLPIPILIPVANLHPREDPVTDGVDVLDHRVNEMDSSEIAHHLMNLEDSAAVRGVGDPDQHCCRHDVDPQVYLTQLLTNLS